MQNVDHKYTLPLSSSGLFSMIPLTITRLFTDGRSSTLIHEAGHWLGLFHTFWGGSCSPVSFVSDEVDDTPAQSRPTRGNSANCSFVNDSCPELPGVATGNNFMDYGDCRTEFTPGQHERMWYQYNTYRRRVEPCGGASVRIEILPDINPTAIDVGYRSFGSDAIGPLVTLMPLWPLETHINFTHQLLSSDICVERNNVHEVLIFDDVRDGMVEPGYVAVFLNDRQVFRQSSFDAQSRVSFFVAGDYSSACDHQSERMTLDLEFGLQDLQDVSWALYTNDTVVVDSTSSTALGRDTYMSRVFKGKTLFFDHCLPPDEYRFRLSVTPGANVSDYIQYYRLALGDLEIYNGTSGDDVFFTFNALSANSSSSVPSMSPAANNNNPVVVIPTMILTPSVNNTSAAGTPTTTTTGAPSMSINDIFDPPTTAIGTNVTNTTASDSPSESPSFNETPLVEAASDSPSVLPSLSPTESIRSSNGPTVSPSQKKNDIPDSPTSGSIHLSTMMTLFLLVIGGCGTLFVL